MHLSNTSSQHTNQIMRRLADTYSDDDQSDNDEGPRHTSRTGRVNVANPRTPGGRVASRSMDIDRDFMFRPEEGRMFLPRPQPQLHSPDLI